MSSNVELWADLLSVQFAPYPSLGVLPQTNHVSQFASLIGVTVRPHSNSTQIVQVDLTFWALGWENASVPIAPPSDPAIINMPISDNVATAALVDGKYFPPGTTVFFNLTAWVSNATFYDQPLSSPCLVGADPSWASGSNPTWEYQVTGAWPSSSFAQDLQLSASPNVFASVDPTYTDPVTFSLSSMNGTLIGGANLYYNVTEEDPATGTMTVSPGGAAFTPVNSTSVEVVVGPFGTATNSTTITFYVVAWQDWSGGAVHLINSHSFTFTVAGPDSWCGMTGGFGNYLALATSDGESAIAPPSTAYGEIASGSDPLIPPLVPVNVTLESRYPAYEVRRALLEYQENYDGRDLSGTLVLQGLNSTSNTTGDLSETHDTALFGLLPPGAAFSFSVLAFDVKGCVLSSPTLSFHTEDWSSAFGSTSDTARVLVQVVDEGRHNLALGARVQVSSLNWTVDTSVNVFGLSYANVSGSWQPWAINLGNWTNITVNYLGETYYDEFFLAGPANETQTVEVNYSVVPPASPTVGNPFLGFPDDLGYLLVGTLVFIAIYSAVVLWIRIHPPPGYAREPRKSTKSQDVDLPKPPPGKSWEVKERPPEDET